MTICFEFRCHRLKQTRKNIDWIDVIAQCIIKLWLDEIAFYFYFYKFICANLVEFQEKFWFELKTTFESCQCSNIWLK
jgi:hypothetical protein